MVNLRKFDKVLLKNALYIWGNNILPGIFGVVFWWLVSQYYSPGDIGLASAVISASLLLSGVSRLGLDIGLIRFLPGSTDYSNFINMISSIVLLLSAIIASLFLILVPILSPKLIFLREHFSYTIGFILLATLAAQVVIFRAAFVAQRTAKYSFWTSVIGLLTRLVVVVLARSVGFVGIVGSVLVANIVGMFFSIHSFLPKIIFGYKPKILFELREILPILSFSFGNYLATFIVQAPQTILPLMVLNTLGENSNGQAYIALMMGSMLASPGASLGWSAFVEGSNSIPNSNRTLLRGAVLGFIVTLLISLATIFVAPYLLRIFGDSFVAGTSLLRWIAISAPVFVLNQFYFNYLRLQKNIKTLVALSSLILLLTLGITAFLLPIKGISAPGIAGLVANLGTILIIITLQRSNIRKSSLAIIRWGDNGD